MTVLFPDCMTYHCFFFMMEIDTFFFRMENSKQKNDGLWNFDVCLSQICFHSNICLAFRRIIFVHFEMEIFVCSTEHTFRGTIAIDMMMIQNRCLSINFIWKHLLFFTSILRFSNQCDDDIERILLWSIFQKWMAGIWTFVWGFSIKFIMSWVLSCCRNWKHTYEIKNSWKISLVWRRLKINDVVDWPSPTIEEKAKHEKTEWSFEWVRGKRSKCKTEMTQK